MVLCFRPDDAIALHHPDSQAGQESGPCPASTRSSTWTHSCNSAVLQEPNSPPRSKKNNPVSAQPRGPGPRQNQCASAEGSDQKSWSVHGDDLPFGAQERPEQGPPAARGDWVRRTASSILWAPLSATGCAAPRLRCPSQGLIPLRSPTAPPKGASRSRGEPHTRTLLQEWGCGWKKKKMVGHCRGVNTPCLLPLLYIVS